MLLVLFMILGGFLLYVSFPLLSQRTIILDTQPVDPFDLVRGQYIIIRYQINTIPTIADASEGDNVYVALEKDVNGTSQYTSASLSKPDEGIFIAGEIQSIYNERMQVEYGIEQYFFERNARFDTRSMLVEAKLSKGGSARINRLLDRNKKPLVFTYENKSTTS